VTASEQVPTVTVAFGEMTGGVVSTTVTVLVAVPTPSEELNTLRSTVLLPRFKVAVA
jgi:hypothetical protein